MKKSEFEKINAETPEYMPRYMITKVPDWVDGYTSNNNVMKGDYYLYHINGVMIPEKDGRTSLRPYPSMFKFIKYVRVKQMTYNDGYYVIE